MMAVCIAISIVWALGIALVTLPLWRGEHDRKVPMELPDDEMRAAMREVDALTPAAPPIEPGAWLRSLVPPDAPDAEVRPTFARTERPGPSLTPQRRANGRPYQIDQRPPPPPPQRPTPTPAPGPGMKVSR